MGEEDKLRDMILKTSKRNIGVLFLAVHLGAVFGREDSINLWIKDRSSDWEISMDLENQNLTILIAYKPKKKWKLP